MQERNDLDRQRHRDASRTHQQEPPRVYLAEAPRAKENFLLEVQRKRRREELHWPVLSAEAISGAK